MPSRLLDIEADSTRRLARQLSLRMATPEDRPAIYRLRHEIYASELGQHAENEEQQLRDGLDEFNHYIVATSDDEVIGFVSITPPGQDRYSVDKYVLRAELPVPIDDGLYEVRLLTVARPHRSSRVTLLLMHAAMRWIDERGGHNVVAIGRREVLGLYQKAGFVLAGKSIKSGAVHYELMTTSLDRARRCAAPFGDLIRRSIAAGDWCLDVTLFRDEPCEHGGNFFRAIGDRFKTLDRRREIINADVLDAWFPPAPEVLAAVREHLEWTMRTSPPTHCEGLVQAISEARRVSGRCIAPAAGSSTLIYLAFREWLGPSSRVMLLDPTYGEYRHVLEQLVGCQVDGLRLNPRLEYTVDLAELHERCQDDYDLVVLVNPNNPTGKHIPRADLEDLLRHAPSRTRFWIDEAYIDYVSSEESLEHFAAESENVVVCKSLSKAYSLSGMRAAYLCGPEAIAKALRILTPPWSIGLPSQIAAVRALESPTYYRQRYQETAILRAGLAAKLRELGLEVNQGTANFLLCDIPPAGPDAGTLLHRCQSQGLFLRDVRSMGSNFGTHTFRIAVKDAETNGRTVTILKRQLHSPTW
ncbi:MAG TPA: aminotransferase class I/II-fold pyridoxal phosphate-dependent enzyme [Planctomycetaceae bacterium]|nr:aminotransferase class I/II-fold pyridoxal phosphate-dependent enzyme [Planctomycetaceae bacterium]